MGLEVRPEAVPINVLVGGEALVALFLEHLDNAVSQPVFCSHSDPSCSVSLGCISDERVFG